MKVNELGKIERVPAFNSLKIIYMNFKKYLILLAFIGLASCNQDSLENEYNDSASKNSIYTTYDFRGEKMTAGEIHNVVLSEIINETAEERNGNPVHDQYVLMTYVKQEYDITFLLEDLSFESQLMFFNENSKRSQDYINIVNNLAEVIPAVENYNEAIELVSLYQKELEKYDLSHEEHGLFMNGLSILEASADYWYNGEGGLGNKQSGGTQNRGIFDCGGNVIGADWVSAVIGAATGGPIGGFLGAAVSSAFAYFTDPGC